MVVGDPAVWASRFRSFDDRFLDCVVAVWPRCLSVLASQPGEDTITASLVDILLRDPDTRRQFHWIEFQYEPFGHTSKGAVLSKGRIDMAVFLNQDRDRYLAYECKRLNDCVGGGRRSLAGSYVRDGLSRFVSGQYSENLPVGCMLGYVLDGDLVSADSSVRAKILEFRSDMALVEEPRTVTGIGGTIRFYSRHRRKPGNAEIEVRHALLPMSVGLSDSENNMPGTAIRVDEAILATIDNGQSEPSSRERA